jgi:hypothetical protein
MKKFAVLLLSCFLFFGCVSNKVADNALVDGKVQTAVTLEQLNSLKKDNIREVEILEKLDSATTYGFDLLNELEFAIAYEKQQAFNEGYDAGKKDAIAATEGYVKLEDVIELLKKQGLYKEEGE